MASQTMNGKAFEYACLQSVFNRYRQKGGVFKEENDAYITAKKYFEELDQKHKEILSCGSDKGMEIVEKLEATLENFSSYDRLFLTIQTDAAGQNGDVRDVIIRDDKNWEIGISAKHNHEAVKHSRLSPTIDFGEKWMGITCSETYFNEINSVFDRLSQLKGEKWNDRDIDKVQDIYKPILDAFIRELNRLYESYGSIVPQRLIRYLIGEDDFYKFILDVKRKIIKVNAYNIAGTLNRKNGSKKSDYNLTEIKLPTKIHYIGYSENEVGYSNNTLELICNNGWQLSFRIHNASSKVELSLKFDIKLIGTPVDIPTFIGVI